MEIIKVIGVGIIGVVVAGLLKNDKPEFHLFVITATGLIILFIILSSLAEVIASFSLLVDKSGVNEALFSGVLKIIGIGYL
ncbi:MAG: stage III sporulation protein AD, partial [Clostridia bacterium]|nr:stage III sporulation protein AD [Clostridia bacterium]